MGSADSESRQGAGTAASVVSIGSALAVVGAVFAFWSALDRQSERMSDSVDAVHVSVSDVERTSQSTRDAVMTLSGKVDALAGSATRNIQYLEKLDERVRTLEMRRAPVDK